MEALNSAAGPSCHFVDNDIDGEALLAALDQGADSLKEIIPSLSQRLKLFGALKLLKKQNGGQEVCSVRLLYISIVSL